MKLAIREKAGEHIRAFEVALSTAMSEYAHFLACMLVDFPYGSDDHVLLTAETEELFDYLTKLTELMQLAKSNQWLV